MSDMEHGFLDALETMIRGARRLGPDVCRDMIAAHLAEMRQEGEDTDTDGILLLERISAAFAVFEGWQDGCDRVVSLADLTAGWAAHFQWDSAARRRSEAYEEAIMNGVARMLAQPPAPETEPAS